MRNLKKILALVLALVMSMSLLATANAFNDDAEIDPTYDEAVTVLANLKVFQGYNNGETFVPKGSITRAEVAAILYRIATGDVDDTQVGIYANYNKFSDVKSTSWYAGYVNYCANAEYIKGYDDKTFGPNDPVTGYQALAMILRAVGYDVNDEFTGTSWQVKVASTANQLGITRNITAGTLGTAATREVVAEILFRAIAEAYIVKWTEAFGYQPVGMTTSVNTNTSGLIAWNGITLYETLGGNTFGLARTEGEITATNRKTGTTTVTPVTTNAATNNDNVLDTNNRVDVINTPGDWTQIGYVAYVYTVPTAGAKTRTAVSDVVLTGTSLGVSTNGTPIASLSTKGNAAFIAELAANNTTRYYYNGVPCAAQKAITAAQNVGVKVDFIDNDNGGLVEVVVITDYTTARVTGIANTSNTGSQAVTYNAYNLTTFDGSNRRIAAPSNNIYDVALVANDVRSVVAVAEADMVCADALAVGDLVTYVEYNGDYYTVKAPLTTNTFSRINYNTVLGTTRSYVVGGTEYLVAAWDVKEYANNSWYSVAVNNLNNGNLGKSFNIYTDPYGNIIYAAPVEAVVNYLFVLANDHTVATTGLTNARVVNTDGSIGNVNIAKLTSGGYPQAQFDLDDLAGYMYGYTTNTDGSYNLVGPCAWLNDADYTTGTSTIYGDSGNVGVNTASVVIDLRGVTISSTSATVYTGYAQVPTFTNGVLDYVTNTNGWVTFAFLNSGVNEEDNFIVYKTGFNYTEVVNGTRYYYLDVMKDGAKVENYQLTQVEYAAIDNYGVGVYSFNRDGSLKEYTAFTEEWATVTWQNGSIKDLTNNTYYTYDGTNVKFNVLNITSGTINDYTMNYGSDYHAYLVKSGTAVKEIYIVVGEVAGAATASHTATWVKDNATYTYYVRDNLITSHVMAAFQTDAPSVVLEGATAVPAWTDNGDNTFDVEVPYATWKNWVGKDYVVSPAVGNEIAVNDRVSFGTANVKVGVTATDAGKGGDQTQVIVVYAQSLTPDAAYTGTKAYTFTVTYKAAAVGTDLFCNGTKVTSPYPYTTATTFDNMVKDFTPSTGAEISWKFYDGAGREIAPNMNTTIDASYVAIATVTAESGATAEYWVYFDDGLTAANQAAVIANRIEDKTDAAEVAAAVAKIKAAGEGFTNTTKALDNVGVPTNVLVPAMMDAWAAAGTAADPDFSNAGLAGKLVNVLVTDLDDAEDLVNAYLGWLANELKVATGSSIVNTCGLTINQTATGWAIDFTRAVVTMNNTATSIDSKAITNSGLKGLSTKLLEKLGGGYEVEIKWPNMIQNGSVGEFIGQWNAMQDAVLGGTSFTLTVTISEKAESSNTIAFQVVLG